MYKGLSFVLTLDEMIQIMLIKKRVQSEKTHYEYKMLIPVIRLTFLRMSTGSFGTRVYILADYYVFRDQPKREVFFYAAFQKLQQLPSI